MKDRKINKKGKIVDKSALDIAKSLHFSFKYLNINHNKFCIKNCNTNYFLKVIYRFKDLSTWSIQQFTNSSSKTLRAHPINWDETTEKNGFSHLNETFQDLPAYQFSISANEYGRIHGFIIDSVFFVVWFDPSHKLYS